MSSVAGNVLKMIKPHIPMIRFRKGGKPHHSGGAPGSAPAGSSARGSGIDESMMPKRYARLAMSEQEAELIMSGGAI